MPNSCTIFLTSRPYAIEVIEALNMTGIPREAGQYGYAEAVDMGLGFLSGTLTTVLVPYTAGADEALDVGGDFLSGSLNAELVDYIMVDEALDEAGDFLSGSLNDVLQTYTMYDEALDIGGDFLSGALT